MHDMFRRQGESLTLSSPGRARTVRRALYIERKRLLRADPLSDLASLAALLQFRIEGATLIVERIPDASPVEAEVRAVRAAQ